MWYENVADVSMVIDGFNCTVNPVLFLVVILVHCSLILIL